MENNKNFIATKAGILSFVDNFIGAMLGWILHMVFSRVLGPVGYGQYSLVYSIFIIFTLIFTPGIAMAIVRYAAISSDAKGVLLSAVRIEIFVDVLIYIIYFVFLSMICRVLAITELEQYCIVLGLMLMPRGLISITKSYLQGILSFMNFFKVSIVENSARFIFCLVLVLLGYGIWGVIIGLVITEILTFIASVVSVGISKLRKSISGYELLRFSLPLWFIGLSGFVMSRIDIFCIQYFLSDYAQVGYYSAATRLVDALALFLSITFVSLLPVLSSAFEQGRYTYAEVVLKRTVRYNFLLSVPICIWAALNANLIMTIVFSAKFSFGGVAFAILSLGKIFISFFTIFILVCIARGRAWPCFTFNLIAICLNLVLNVALIPLWGINGAALATIISLLCADLVLFVYEYRNNILPAKRLLWIEIRTVFKVCLIISILFILYKFLNLPIDIFMLFLQTILFTVFYFLLLWFLKVINAEDKEILKAIAVRLHSLKIKL